MRRSLLRHSNIARILEAAATKPSPKPNLAPKGPDVPRLTRVTKLDKDPLGNMMELKQSLKRSRFKDGDLDHTDEDDKRKWMEVRQAARLLSISEPQLFDLLPNEVHAHFARVYPSLSSAAARKEAVIASEVLLDYITSRLHMDKTQSHFKKVIHNTAVDIEETLANDKEEKLQAAFALSGVGVGLTFLFFAACGLLMRRMMTADEVAKIIDNTRFNVLSTFGAHTSSEPPPDYETRYRDTPSAAEIHETRPHPEVHDRLERAAMTYVDEINRNEEALLANIYVDETRYKQQQRLQEQQGSSSPVAAKSVVFGTGPSLAVTEALMKTAMKTLPSPLQLHVGEGFAREPPVELRDRVEEGRAKEGLF